MINHRYMDETMLTLDAIKHNVGVPEQKIFPSSGHMQSPWSLGRTGDQRILGTLRSLPSQCMLILDRSFSIQQPSVLGQALRLEPGVRSEVCLAGNNLCPQNLIQTWQMCQAPIAGYVTSAHIVRRRAH